MRRIWVVLALVAATACQQDDSYRSKPEVATISLVKADVLAKAAVLKPADVPGYKRTDTTTETANVEPSNCVRSPTPYVATRGVDFEHGDVGIGSIVEVAPTLERVQYDFGVVNDDDFLTCLKGEMNRQGQLEGFEVVSFKARLFTVRVPKSDGSYGVSMRLTVKVGDDLRNMKVPLHVMIVAAAVDHAEITVSGTGLRRDAPASSRLSALAAKLVSRTRAAISG